jgi:hypothetical protein
MTVRQTPEQATDAPSASDAVSYRVAMVKPVSPPRSIARTSPTAVMIPVNMPR